MSAIVFIHGAGDSAIVWERQIHHFSKSHQVFAIEIGRASCRERV